MFNAWPASVDWLCDLSWLGWEGPVFLYITCFCNSSLRWTDKIAIMCMDVWCTTGLLTLVEASLGWDKRVRCSCITCFCNSSSWWADNIAIMRMDVWCTTGLLTLIEASLGWDKRVRCSYITCFCISSSWWANGQRKNVAVQDVWCTASHRTDWGGQLMNCTHHATVISNRVRSTAPVHNPQTKGVNIICRLMLYMWPLLGTNDPFLCWWKSKNGICMVQIHIHSKHLL